MKRCTMNCGQAAGDTRTRAEIMRTCTDCVEVPEKVLTDFEKGILYAAGIVCSQDMPGVAADILREAGLTEADCTDLDGFDKEQLRLLSGEREVLISKG